MIANILSRITMIALGALAINELGQTVVGLYEGISASIAL